MLTKFAVLFLGGSMAASSPRLIKLDPLAPAQWMDEAQIESLHQDNEALHKKGVFGYMDITSSSIDTDKARQNRRSYTYPSEPTKQAVLVPLLNELSEERLADFLLPLTEFHNRYYTSQSGYDASVFINDYAESLIEASGREDASVFLSKTDFLQPNIVARIEGKNASAPMLILGAHMDSINSVGPIESWEDALAPGADDDGSGSTVVMEVFNVLLNSGFKGERPLEFQWYAGEERGLLGSRILAESYREEDKEVYAMLQIDMCAGGGPMNFIMDYVSVSLSNFEHRLVDEYCEVGYVEGACGYACSDHASWFEYGYPSSFPIESAGSGGQGHTETDEFQFVDFQYVKEYAKLGLSFFVELADFV